MGADLYCRVVGGFLGVGFRSLKCPSVFEGGGSKFEMSILGGSKFEMSIFWGDSKFAMSFSFRRVFFLV